jgi:hypothetical protein
MWELAKLAHKSIVCLFILTQHISHVYKTMHVNILKSQYCVTLCNIIYSATLCMRKMRNTQCWCPGVNPTKLFFFVKQFFSIFFAVELGHVKIQTIFSDVTNNLNNENLKFGRSQVYNVRLI